MHKAFLCLLGLTTWAATLAQTAPEKTPVEKIREHGQASPLAYQLVESLTTEVGPRLGGSANDARAVLWAQKKLKALGFDRVHTEPVTFPRWVRGVEQAEITAPYPQKLAVTALGGSGPTPAEGITAEVVAFDSLEALKKARKHQIKDKIVFVNQPMPRFRDGHGYGQTVGVRYMAAQLTAEKGGKAVLIRSIATDNNRLPHTGIMKVSPEQPGVPAAALSVPDAILLDNMLERGQPVSVHLQLGSHWDGQYTSQNVLGDLTGSEKPDEFVILACHLDSWDLGTGAIDDGAGCAIMMAAVAHLKALGLKPKRSIRVLLAANEEYGLAGAKAYAKAHAGDLKSHVIGGESDFGAGRIYRFDSHVEAHAFGLMDQVAQAIAPLGVMRGSNHAHGGADVSALKKAGMPVVDMQQEGDDYFDYHHTANDTLDKIDPEAIAQNATVWSLFAWLAANYPDHFGWFEP